MALRSEISLEISMLRIIVEGELGEFLEYPGILISRLISLLRAMP